MKLTGTVTRIKDIEQVSEKFSKQELIIEVQDKEYTNIFCIEFINDKVKLLEGVSVGQQVTVDTNVRCKHWEASDKYFTTLSGWKLSNEQTAKPATIENSNEY
jgi:acetyltransferase-like isoleucine patch superfamily enzyme